jgi:hypothetical protein
MTVSLTCVDLAEAGHPVTEIARKDNPGLAPYLVIKGKLGAGEQANGYRWVIHRGKPA